MLHAVIMAGGSGTRFWPASRERKPKQLLDLTGGKTMIEATVDRLGSSVSADRVLIVTNERLVAPITELLPQLPPTAVLGEPCKRDTAPCVALAAAAVLRNDPHATMVVMPADHIIQPESAFQAAIANAQRIVEQNPDYLVTFGITPTYAAETFGYIERGRPLDLPGSSTDGSQAYRVEEFHEKPDGDTAQEYLDAGNYYWNSGIFVWKARTILDAIRRFEPEIVRHIDTIAASFGHDDFNEVLTREFQLIEGKSIDYAVMENYDEIAVLLASFEWDDVGNWQSLARTYGLDENGNTLIGKQLAHETTGSIVRSDDEHLIVTVGLTDCIVVHTENATLVANKHDEESVRKVVEMLQERGWNEYL